MKRFLVLLLVLALSVPFVVAACGEEEESPSPSPSPTMAMMDIVETAQGAGDFTTLVTALQAAGLDETLQGEGPFTVFAPNDAAFNKVPKDTLDGLLADPTGSLTDVLTYHVVAGKVMSGDLSDGMTAETVNGAEITITIEEDGTVMVNDAKVVTADIECSNGVIHVIDTVLLPPSE
jgi:uncharacterized surface protein with fasciclin (FAS1) repeats